MFIVFLKGGNQLFFACRETEWSNASVIFFLAMLVHLYELILLSCTAQQVDIFSSIKREFDCSKFFYHAFILLNNDMD